MEIRYVKEVEPVSYQVIQEHAPLYGNCIFCGVSFENGDLVIKKEDYMGFLYFEGKYKHKNCTCTKVMAKRRYKSFIGRK